jgi:hypothetical protein
MTQKQSQAYYDELIKRCNLQFGTSQKATFQDNINLFKSVAEATRQAAELYYNHCAIAGIEIKPTLSEMEKITVQEMLSEPFDRFQQEKYGNIITTQESKFENNQPTGISDAENNHIFNLENPDNI